MFDNTKPNIIILSDLTDIMAMNKTLGPYRIAYMLRQQGYEVAVIHHISVFTVPEIKNMLSQMVSDQTLFIGVNGYFYANCDTLATDINYKDGMVLTSPDLGSFLPHGKQHNKDIKKLVTDINPRCKFVAGGPTATDSEVNRDFDYVCKGYAEISILDLANHLHYGTELKDSQRSLFGFTLLTNSKAEGFSFADYEMRYEDHDLILNDEVLMLEVARGCIFRCTFCSFPLNGKKKFDYIRSRDSLRQELIDNYERFGITRYMLGDDTFNDSVDKCKMLYEITQSLPFKIEFFAYLRLDLLAAHPETIEYVFDSGCRGAFFGIETMNPKTASIIGKGGRREKLIETIEYIKNKYGDRVSLFASFIYGLPYEDLDSLQQTTDWLLSPDNPLDSFAVYALNIASGASSKSFLSELDLNYKDYGYEEIQPLELEQMPLYSKQRYHTAIHWRNQYTDYVTIKKVVDDLMVKVNPNLNTGIYMAFMIASLGIDLDILLNKRTSDIDWHSIDKTKLKRSIEYKQKFYEVFKISLPKQIDPPLKQLLKYKTFTNYLAKRNLK